ncbi:MAG: homoserine O-acetyltransferase [Thiohalorhabdus sp.]|uniref:homoserine O-acetyltransferase MetX n=1 Tax=Thiohalorhabdus sp. TaxID=3094134 RepID=UPI00397F8D0B
MSGATKYLHLDGPFEMVRGGALPEVTLAYETWGELSPERDNAILIFTGLSPSAHAASSMEDPSRGWWEFMIGPGRALDTSRYFVICINNLGSCFGSTGPASTNPETGRPYRLDFPELSVEDIVRSQRQALHKLGIERLHAVVGASLGGMSALAFAVTYPDDVDELVVISAATRATPFAIAIRSLQRDCIKSDPAWRGGFYPEGQQPQEGMRLARKLGLMSYRSPEEWLQRFGRERVEWLDEPGSQPFDIEFQVESYLEANARKFVRVCDANCYLYLSRAMDLFDLGEHAEDWDPDTALKRVRARRALVLGVETDFLFPVWQQRAVADGLKEAGLSTHYMPLSSVQGHDAFLVDKARFIPVVGEFFSSGGNTPGA